MRIAASSWAGRQLAAPLGREPPALDSSVFEADDQVKQR